MGNQKKQIVWQCQHPKDQLFMQITNHGTNYDVVYCRCCGKFVEKIYKKSYIKNVS
jgi:hypothetical protein